VSELAPRSIISCVASSVNSRVNRRRRLLTQPPTGSKFAGFAASKIGDGDADICGSTQPSRRRSWRRILMEVSARTDQPTHKSNFSNGQSQLHRRQLPASLRKRVCPCPRGISARPLSSSRQSAIDRRDYKGDRTLVINAAALFSASSRA
jgi:hypothetical protein